MLIYGLILLLAIATIIIAIRKIKNTAFPGEKIGKEKSFGMIMFLLFLIPYAWMVVGFIDEGILRESNFRFFGISISAILLICIFVGIFRLRNWARLICIWGSVVFILWGLIPWFFEWNPLDVKGLGGIAYFFPLVFGIPTIIYLILPRVKKQFKNQVV